MDEASYLAKVKSDLDAVSPSFCIAKWNMVTLHLAHGETHSCYHPYVHKIDAAALKENPSAIHNTDQKKQRRREMLDGQRPKECVYCWNMEDLGQMSDRVLHSGSPWSHTRLEEIAAMPWDADVVPKDVEVSFSSACNLKCTYCNPTYSSKWLEEAQQFGAYPTSTRHGGIGDKLPYIPEREANPYIDAFWAWWPTLYQEVELLRVTGGEPLMTKHTFRLLEKIAEAPKPDLQVAVNSNLSVPDALVDRLIEVGARLAPHVKTFRVHPSVDSWGEQAEYARTGLDITRFEKNVRRILDEVPSAIISFMVTFNVLSVPRFHLFLEKIVELRSEFGAHRVAFDTPYLRYPPHQSVQILPAAFAGHLDGNLTYMRGHGFSHVEITKMERLKAWMLKPLDPADLERRLKDFHAYFSEHDRRRATDFRATFPELSGFYDSCAALRGV